MLAGFFKKRNDVCTNVRRLHRGSDISEIALLDSLSQKISKEEILQLKRIVGQLVTYTQSDDLEIDNNLVKIYGRMCEEGRRIALEAGVLIPALTDEYAFCQIYKSKGFDISSSFKGGRFGYYEKNKKGACVPVSFLYIHYFGPQFRKSKIVIESVENGFRKNMIIEALNNTPYQVTPTIGNFKVKPLKLTDEQPWKAAIDSIGYNVHGEIFCTPYQLLKNFYEFLIPEMH